MCSFSSDKNLVYIFTNPRKNLKNQQKIIFCGQTEGRKLIEKSSHSSWTKRKTTSRTFLSFRSFSSTFSFPFVFIHVLSLFYFPFIQRFSSFSVFYSRKRCLHSSTPEGIQKCEFWRGLVCKEKSRDEVRLGRGKNALNLRDSSTTNTT